MKGYGRSSLALVTAAGLLVAASNSAFADTRGFVVSWFGLAEYFGGDSDCPDGLNPMSTEFYRRDLLRLGYSPEEATRLLKDFPGTPGSPDGEYIAIMQKRGDKNHNVYTFPETEPDPGLKEVKGKFAYGFNLDGNVDSPISFTDPDTAEKGVKNQLYRTIGCVQSFRAPPPSHDYLSQVTWEQLRDNMPAWLIEVSGITDPMNSSDVRVEISRATRPILRDATAAIRAGVTYKQDPDPRSHSVLHGHIKDGVIYTDPADIRIIADPLMAPEYRWSRAQMRLKINSDGSLKALLGGYLDWYSVYWAYAAGGWAYEHSGSLDMVALWYSLKRHADADPDPATGQNKSISTAYDFEGVPAFVVHANNRSSVADATQAKPASKRLAAGN